jgi:hypothetical protein
MSLVTFPKPGCSGITFRASNQSKYMPSCPLLAILPRWLLTSLVTVFPIFGAIGQSDPLSLESAPVEKVEKTSGSAKIFVEGSIGNASQRYLPKSLDTRRASFDLSYSGQVGTGLRAVFSDRIDVVHPTSPGADSTINSLREAYLSWQPDGGNSIVDFGRINVRSGPGYGYNPTDFFRDGSLRVLTSADPFALRQNRIGSVMLRGQHLWNGGSLSVAYSPKLATSPSADGWSLDLGSTNNRDRFLMTLGSRISEVVNTQLLLYKDEGMSTTLGANMTALLSDAATAHLEWTYGREPDLLSRVLAIGPGNGFSRNRFVGGATYTTLGKTSITAEYQYNGFALTQSGWAALAAVPGAQLGYLGGALRLQELAPREAILVYVTQKSLWLKDLDLTAYLRFNLKDNSKLAWFELRHHWSNFDLSFQFQQNLGRANSEFGILPDRRVMQVLGTYYF